MNVAFVLDLESRCLWANVTDDPAILSPCLMVLKVFCRTLGSGPRTCEPSNGAVLTVDKTWGWNPKFFNNTSRRSNWRLEAKVCWVGTCWVLIQCKPDISRSRISRNWIYRGRMLDPIFWRPRARYFSRNRGNSLDPIRGGLFFAKSAHRDSLCSRFAGDNFSRNQLKPTCQCGLEHMLCDGQPR